MLLAAGLGKRMLHLTKQCPKPLLKVSGKPLLHHAISHLIKNGITEIVINTHYESAMIIKYINDNKFSANIHLIVEDELLDTGAGICNALKYLGPEPFIVASADVISNINYQSLYLPKGSSASLAMVKNPSFKTAGDYSIIERKLIQKQSSLESYTYANVGLFHHSFFTHQKPGPTPLRFYIDRAIAKQRVHAFVYRGSWFNIGTPEQLQECEANIIEN